MKEVFRFSIGDESECCINVSSWIPITCQLVKGDIVQLKAKVNNYQVCSLAIKGDDGFIKLDENEELQRLRAWRDRIDFNVLKSLSNIKPKYSERKDLSLIREIKSNVLQSLES